MAEALSRDTTQVAGNTKVGFMLLVDALLCCDIVPIIIRTNGSNHCKKK